MRCACVAIAERRLATPLSESARGWRAMPLRAGIQACIELISPQNCVEKYKMKEEYLWTLSKAKSSLQRSISRSRTPSSRTNADSSPLRAAITDHYYLESSPRLAYSFNHKSSTAHCMSETLSNISLP